MIKSHTQQSEERTNKAIVALTGFESVLPTHVMGQTEAVAFCAEMHANAVFAEGHKLVVGGDYQLTPESVRSLALRYAIKPTQIARRYFENLDLGVANANIYERAIYYGERAHEVLKELYPAKGVRPAHIVHVTCTGYLSPSAPQRLVDDNHWNGQTDVTHAYHMGCYAALPAVRMAEGLVAARSPNVDIVHNEMCSLHFSTNDHSIEQLLVQSLFADGHIKYSAVPVDEAASGFRVLNIGEQIVRDSHQDMSWAPTGLGMKMSLSKDVPSKIGGSLRSFLMRLLGAQDEQIFAKTLREADFAIHPGGPKIIEAVQSILELRPDQVVASQEVLKERGNMSSATLPHVWQKMLAQKGEPNKLVVSLAFGPGLTIFGALFERI